MSSTQDSYSILHGGGRIRVSGGKIGGSMRLRLWLGIVSYTSGSLGVDYFASWRPNASVSSHPTCGYTTPAVQVAQSTYARQTRQAVMEG